MSILNGMTTLVTQLRDSIDTEESRLEKNLQASIHKVISETSSAFQTVFSDIVTALEHAGEIVDSDLKTIESGLTGVVSTLESTAESEYQNFSNLVEGSITKIKGVAASVSDTVGSATSYLRTGAAQDFDALVTKARTDFDTLKSGFKTAIGSLANDLATKTRAGIASVVSSAQSDIDRLNTMKNTILSDIKTHVGDIVSDLKKIKDKATADLERIVGFIRNELDKLETRVDKMEGRFNRVGLIVAGVSVCVAVASGLRMMDRAHQSKVERINAARKLQGGTKAADSRQDSASDNDYMHSPRSATISPHALQSPQRTASISPLHNRTLQSSSHSSLSTRISSPVHALASNHSSTHISTNNHSAHVSSSTRSTSSKKHK